MRLYEAGVQKFQSTLPMRGGTKTSRRIHPLAQHFNPPSPCGEGQLMQVKTSISLKFQSTLPMRGGTVEGESDSQTL